jgi:5-methylthioribose kinase
MTRLQNMPVIGELMNGEISPKRSKFVIFLNGDVSDMNEENIIDEGYFDNCYSYDQFMEDVLFIENLRDERDFLKAELQKAKDSLTLFQNQQSN